MTHGANEFAARVIPRYDEACDRALDMLVKEAYHKGFSHGQRKGVERGIEIGRNQILNEGKRR